jgi:dUTPase
MDIMAGLLSDRAWRSFITSIGAGVIDGDYRGNVGVLLFNHSNSHLVRRCDKIAQFVKKFSIQN